MQGGYELLAAAATAPASQQRRLQTAGAVHNELGQLIPGNIEAIILPFRGAWGCECGGWLPYELGGGSVLEFSICS